MNRDVKKVKKLLHTGSEIAGAAFGGVLGFIIGGPVGAATGGIVGIITSNSGKWLTDFANRRLSKREETKVGATAIFAIAKIIEYLEAGQDPRQDNFFSEDNNKRSDAEEIFEGVLQKSKKEHEEKKIKFLGNIFANIAFTTGLSFGEANHILHIAEDLTFRKFCILSLVERKTTITGIVLREKYYEEDHEDSIPIETISIAQEVCELYQRGLITSDVDIINWSSVAPNKLSLTKLGKRCYTVMGLQDISIEDLMGIAVHLSVSSIEAEVEEDKH